jgi:hypothetical protein
MGIKTNTPSRATTSTPPRARLTDAEILAQIPAARARWRRARATEPHAAAAHYDEATGRLVVVLTNGGSFAVPIAAVPELRGVSVRSLAAVEVEPTGVGLSWPALDVDLSVTGLARLVLGGATLARDAGARGGRARTETKAEAARRNGAKGGRPPKTQAGSAPSVKGAKGGVAARKGARRPAATGGRRG